MSRMMAPEMEVVRFQEADVIVASTDPTVYLGGFGNYSAANNYATLSNAPSGNGKYSVTNPAERDAFIGILEGNGYDRNPIRSYIVGGYNDDDDDVNGYYIWDGSNWIHQ